MYDLVEKDIKRMKTAVFNVKTSWEKFEEIMATLLDILISKPKFKFGHAIYFTINSTDERFKIINAVVISIFEKNQYSDQLLTLWRKLHLRLNKIELRRKVITQGNILPVNKKNGKTFVRLINKSFDAEIIKQWMNPGTPGFTIEKINFTAADINELCHLFTLVTVLISCINSKDNAGLLKIIYKLQERL